MTVDKALIVADIMQGNYFIEDIETPAMQKLAAEVRRLREEKAELIAAVDLMLSEGVIRDVLDMDDPTTPIQAQNNLARVFRMRPTAIAAARALARVLARAKEQGK